MKKKALFDFMKEKKKYEFDDFVFDEEKRFRNKLIWESGKLFFTVGKTNKMYLVKSEDDFIDIYEQDTKLEIRICDICGSPMQSGFTDDDGDFYCCSDECFKIDMNERYGEGKWRATEDGEENEYGGYYEYLNKNNEWVSEPSYYTEWT